VSATTRKCYGGPFHGQTLELEDGEAEWPITDDAGETHYYRLGADGNAWLSHGEG
jgi:hypothetical protein